MKRFFRKNLPSIICGAIALIIMWLVWIISVKTVKNEYVIPGVKQTFSALFDVFKEALFWRALLRTLAKTVIAVAISFVLAGIFSLPTKMSKNFGRVMRPIVAVIRTLPTMAVLVLILIYTDRTTAPVIVAMLVLFPMSYAQFNVALNGIDEGVVRTAKVFNLTKKQKVFKVYLPLVAPNVLSHLGSNLSFGIKVIVSAEVMALTYTSIGGMIQSANALMDVPRLFALTLVAVILGILVEAVFQLLLTFAFKWTRAEGGND